MKKWYITPSSNLMLDTETESVKRIKDNYTSIENVYITPEDCDIIFSRDDEESKTFSVKKGQLVITFYKHSLPNQLVICDCEGLYENIQAYNNELQQEKERWAAAEDHKCECCDSCKPVSND